MTVSQIRRQWLLASAIGARRMKQALEQLGTRAEPGPAPPTLPACLARGRRSYQRLTGVRPPIRVRLLLVVIRQVRPETLLEILERTEVAAAQELPRHDAEEQFHLVQPRAMHRCVVEHMP